MDLVHLSFRSTGKRVAAVRMGNDAGTGDTRHTRCIAPSV